MNDENTINDVITDSMSQINTMVIGSSVPQSLGMLDITGTETLGMSMYNAVTTQQNAQISASAAVTATCARIIQAQGPLPAPESTGSKDIPPPFMPLDPNSKLSDLSEAEAKKLIATLQNYFKTADGSTDKNDKNQTVNNPPASAKEPDNKPTVPSEENGKKPSS